MLASFGAVRALASVFRVSPEAGPDSQMVIVALSGLANMMRLGETPGMVGCGLLDLLKEAGGKACIFAVIASSWRWCWRREREERERGV